MKNLLFLILAAANAFAVEAAWKPVTPDILALKTPKIDPQADAEAIFGNNILANSPFLP